MVISGTLTLESWDGIFGVRWVGFFCLFWVLGGFLNESYSGITVILLRYKLLQMNFFGFFLFRKHHAVKEHV